MIQRLARRLGGSRQASADLAALNDPWPACRAPHTALRFSPSGNVRACCANDKISLGKVGEVSLREIWEGAPIRDLALALESGDYSQGCDDCAPGIIADREATPAANFDRFPRQARSSWPLRLEFALSNRCNLGCVMCNGELSSVIRKKREGRAPMPRAYGDEFFEEIVPFLRHARETAFIGGEPFLEPGARTLLDQLIVLGRPGDVHVTTNGTIADERVETYLDTLRMDVAVSIDAATKETFESIRLGAKFDEVMANRNRFLEITRTHNRSLVINFCLMNNNWHELHLMCLEADEVDVPLQVIPVFYPPEFSPLCLPDDELAEIVEQMEDIGREARPLMRRNGDVWDASLDLLRDHVRRAKIDEIPVSLRARQIGRSARSAPAQELGDLQAWSEWEPIIFKAGAIPSAVELTAALERWLGQRNIIEAHAQDPGYDWTGQFNIQSGAVTVRTARMTFEGPYGTELIGVAVAFDQDPSLLVPTAPAELLAARPIEDIGRLHRDLVAEAAADLEQRSGRAPIRFDVVSGKILNSVMPSWMSQRDETFEARDPEAVILPGSDGVTVHDYLDARAPLVTHGRGKIPVGDRHIGVDVVIVQQYGSYALTVLLAPDEVF